ncbi:hypothetical protein JN01_0649 [Entomoplasma freundtii]|uniref:Uncharacterized protein n=1 Tax=Entomoplasma freundtii TaxID=74700 RepID=A0A2K8NRG1_9MOLU|nr:hypothetical protein [Entomoplasma freundtii]ATZ16435.1 hypothetical protein EFREU_v1c04090 [Entomoplasma freundtii]TDY55965.1 hypothetical protein JN01_0649 [Entomoplasma freundtii]
MMKLLTLFGSALAFSGASINPLLTTHNVTNTNHSLNATQDDFAESIDKISYSLSPGETQDFSLPNLLNLIQDLNNIHKETGKKVNLYGIPTWGVNNAEGLPLAFGYISSIAFTNLGMLLNADEVVFQETSLLFTARDNRDLQAVLHYQVCGLYQQVELFKVTTPNIPIEQENLQISFSLSYFVSEK